MNQAIAHYAHKIGGEPWCKKRGAFQCVTPDNTMGYQICKRCEAKLQKRLAKKAKD